MDSQKKLSDEETSTQSLRFPDQEARLRESTGTVCACTNDLSPCWNDAVRACKERKKMRCITIRGVKDNVARDGSARCLKGPTPCLVIGRSNGCNWRVGVQAKRRPGSLCERLLRNVIKLSNVFHWP